MRHRLNVFKKNKKVQNFSSEESTAFESFVREEISNINYRIEILEQNEVTEIFDKGQLKILYIMKRKLEKKLRQINVEKSKRFQ